jgi:hypothetical protein
MPRTNLPPSDGPRDTACGPLDAELVTARLEEAGATLLALPGTGHCCPACQLHMGNWSWLVGPRGLGGGGCLGSSNSLIARRTNRLVRTMSKTNAAA